jgi:hypothetical protein
VLKILCEFGGLWCDCTVVHCGSVWCIVVVVV